MPTHEGLELKEDIAFERGVWRFQRAGAAGMGVFIAAALLGLFGAGAASTVRRRSADGGAAAEYQRFARRLAPTELRLELRADQPRDGKVTVLVDRGYLERFEIQKITPRPEAELAGPDGVRYRFAVAAGDEPSRIAFGLRGRRFGRARGFVGVDGRPAAPIRQFVYP